MIKIIFDNKSDFIWMEHMISMGILNTKKSDSFCKEFERLGLSLKRTLTYSKSDNYVDDIDAEKDSIFNKNIEINIAKTK